MSKVIFRDVVQDDITEVKKLVGMTLNFSGQVENDSLHRFAHELSLEIYANQLLSRSSFSKAAEIDGKTVGVIFCGAAGESIISGMMRKLRDIFAEHTSSLPNDTETDDANIGQVIEMFDRLSDLHLKGKGHDGQLLFLAVSSEARGLKIGRKLWVLAVEYFRSQNARSIYLLTDSSNDYGFYEHMGLTRQHEAEIENDLGGSEPKSVVYFYDYHLEL